AVTISSPYASVHDFGHVRLNLVTVSKLSVLLMNSGSIYEYFGISVSNTSGGWTASASAPSTDTFRLSGQLNASQPAQGSGNFSEIGRASCRERAEISGQASSRTKPRAGSNRQKME